MRAAPSLKDMAHQFLQIAAGPVFLAAAVAALSAWEHVYRARPTLLWLLGAGPHRRLIRVRVGLGNLRALAPAGALLLSGKQS
jgi:hypothetical protein